MYFPHVPDVLGEMIDLVIRCLQHPEIWQVDDACRDGGETVVDHIDISKRAEF